MDASFGSVRFTFGVCLCGILHHLIIEHPDTSLSIRKHRHIKLHFSNNFVLSKPNDRGILVPKKHRHCHINPCAFQQLPKVHNPILRQPRHNLLHHSVRYRHKNDPKKARNFHRKIPTLQITHRTVDRRNEKSRHHLHHYNSCHRIPSTGQFVWY